MIIFSIFKNCRAAALAVLFAIAFFSSPTTEAATRYQAIKRVLGASSIQDERVRVVAIEAQDDIATTLGLLCHPTITLQEITDKIRWQQASPPLLPPPSRGQELVGQKTEDGRTILRRTYVPAGAKDWAVAKDGVLSFVLTYADPFAPGDTAVERQSYRKLSDSWTLIKQERIPSDSPDSSM